MKTPDTKATWTARHYCTHCGETCTEGETIHHGEFHFCCSGCATIFQWLQHSDGKGRESLQIPSSQKFEYLDSSDIAELLLQYQDKEQAVVEFSVPKIHCSSCILILEKLTQLDLGIISSRLNFHKKRINIRYKPDIINLRKVVELLDYLGYPPHIHLQKDKNITDSNETGDALKLGIAGFVFGNVMLMSFPSYLGLDNIQYERLFGYISVALSIPLLSISAYDYLKSGISSLIQRTLNLDVSISIGILALFIKSVYDIIFQIGPGYLDSLAGFVFFLLIGKKIQQWTYQHVSFDKGYHDYFPLHTTRIEQNNKIYIALSKVKVGDTLFIRNGDMIPADGLLENCAHARIDYSFVTGESEPVSVQEGDKIYAGGINTGPVIQCIVSKSINQTYLTSLWSEDTFQKIKNIDQHGILDHVGKYFTTIILLIAFITLIYWMYVDVSMAMHTFVAVLIIACPCVLALSIPYTYGSMRNLLARNNIYFRSTEALEALHHMDEIIFDKTGTLTTTDQGQILFKGQLSKKQSSWVSSLASNSSHPLSQIIHQHLHGFSSVEFDRISEIPGKGIEGEIENHRIILGSASHVMGPTNMISDSSKVYIKIDNEVLGYFEISTPLKPGVAGMLNKLLSSFQLHLLSGDNDHQRPIFQKVIGIKERFLHFWQSPYDKLNYIKSLQVEGQQVMMVGDGLNDSGAMRQSDLAVAVRDELHQFIPATDVLIPSKALHLLPSLIQSSRSLSQVVKMMYGFSILYNGIGLLFAVQGLLTPVVAAILMPISSLTIVCIGSFSTWYIYWRTIKSQL